MADKPKKTVIYQSVADKILQSLENGVAPWVKPWKSSGIGMPANAKTKKAYQGINQLLLAMAQEDENFVSSRWLSFKQAKDLGGGVKGEKSKAFVVFFKRRPNYDDRWIGAKEEKELVASGKKDEIRYVPFLTSTPAFNLDQVSGCRKPLSKKSERPRKKLRRKYNRLRGVRRTSWLFN